MTQVLRVDPQHPEPDPIRRAAQILRSGGLVAFPTETVYGLGADALNAKAVARIFQVKGRPSYDPIIVHVADMTGLEQVVSEVPAVVYRLAQRWMPGPLTLVLPKDPRVPDVVTAGKPTVAVRMPAHPVALALIREAGCPIAAPSANRFGHTSPTRAEHVLADLGDAVDLVLDAGPTPIGVESTVLDLTQEPPVILRPGGAPREALEALLGPIQVLSKTAAPEDVRAPGTLPRHYAPEGSQLWLFVGPQPLVRNRIRATLNHLLSQGRRVGVLLPQEDLDAMTFPEHPALRVISLGPEADPREMARRLFAGLRHLEGQGVEVILARDVVPRDLGLAVRDRLYRAAERVIHVET